MTNVLLKNRELECLPISEKIAYFNYLKECVLDKPKSDYKESIHQFILKKYPLLREYDYEIEGEENIPDNGNCLFMFNHSNSHDIFSVLEIFNHIGSRITPFVASDDLSFLTNYLFSSCDAVMLDRNDKSSTERAVLNFASKIVNGIPGAIFGEATWNLHPVKPMQTLKIGGAQIAAITKVPIVPVILEYVEVPNILNSESKLYEKCIVRFLKPIFISRSESLITQTGIIQNNMENARISLWKELGTFREKLSDVDQLLYLNHTYLKKFKAFGFTYDSAKEATYLFSKDKTPVENEFCLDAFGNFVPGVTNKREGKKYLKL